MKHAFTLFSSLLFLLHSPVQAAEAPAVRPNVLFIIADDASRHFGDAYGCKWVKTPNIDRLAKAGLVFDNAYTPTSKCAPSRAAILTGRNPWQLEDAANHQPYFPSKFMAFSEVLAKAGILTGSAGKTWGPGEAMLEDGSKRDFALSSSGGKGDPATGFAAFLKKRTPGTPFFFWFGSSNPHRGYKPDSGIAAGKKPSDIERVPAYWPDNDLIRRDMLDYAIEVEAYDAQIGELLSTLDASGEAKNTLIIITSDHGMPFPRVKGHTYDDAHHIPFIANWPAGIIKPGRRVAEFISFIDLAPTFLDLFGVNGAAQGMSPITGRSFKDLLHHKPTGERTTVIVGRERNDVLARPGSPAGLGYPARAIRSGNLFYIHNFEPDRWPCGNPELGLTDTDASPSKSLATDSGEKDPFWQHSFGKRPADQLFDLASDPDCVLNLATDPAFADKLATLRNTLMSELKKQNDPRALGQGDVFDQYLSPRMKAGEDKLEKKKKKAKQ
ncbi:MAG: sulfatase [Verrucomicrobia bacterium]|nr:sulfatase [Verrucomicrobiota bacterium]